MGRKARRRLLHYSTAGFGDGAIIAAGPCRKPSPKRIRGEKLHIDEDGVFGETSYGPDEWIGWELSQRVKAATVLANRINTRRSIRELVLPEITNIMTTLQCIEERLAKIERSLRSCKNGGNA